MKGFFKFEERNTNFRTELLAGFTTFLTMSYIIFVNPAILSVAGVPFNSALTATVLGTALASILMGIITNRPLALAPGMGLNAVIAFSVIGVGEVKLPWQVGMAVIFLEGAIILALVLLGLREAVMKAIPMNLKRAIGVGIGIFITFIGLNEGGIIRPAPSTLVSLGDLSQSYVWVSLFGLIAISALMALRIKGELLLGIFATTIFAVVLGIVKLPQNFTAPLEFETFLAPFQRVDGSIALARLASPLLLMTVFAVLLTDFFDTMGTVVAVGEQAGFVEKDGRIQGIKGILAVDSFAAMIGGLFGASSITTYIESAAGVAEGGRTGLTAIIAGLLFLVAAFFSPVVKMIGGGVNIANTEQYKLLVEAGFHAPAGNYYVYPITAGVLIIVGFLMMKVGRDIEWENVAESLPSFLIIVGIPLTHNISHGIGLGFISYTLMKIFFGRFRDIHPLMFVMSIAFLVTFALPWIVK